MRTSEGGCITTFASGQEVTQGVVTHFTAVSDILQVGVGGRLVEKQAK